MKKSEDMLGWKPMRIPDNGSRDSPLPGVRGRYLLLLDYPLVEEHRHWVHFSWRDTKFVLRDYIKNIERVNRAGEKPEDIWKVALKRLPCDGEYYRPHTDAEFWKQRCQELTDADGLS